MEMVDTFTAEIVTREIKSCRNSKLFGANKLSIFRLKNLGPRAIEYITAHFNLSVTNCQIPAIWKSSLIIPIPKPGKDTSHGCSYRIISLLCPTAKVLSSTNIFNLLQTSTVLDKNTRPPQLLDTSLSFNKHSSHVSERVSSIHNILKAWAGTSWGQ